MYSDSGQSVIAFTEKGTVYSWGYNSSGCLGLQNNSNSPILAPSPIQKGLEGFRITQVSCGRLFSLALSSNGEVMMLQCMFIKHFHACRLIWLYRFFLGAPMEMDNSEIIQQMIHLFQSK